MLFLNFWIEVMCFRVLFNIMLLNECLLHHLLVSHALYFTRSLGWYINIILVNKIYKFYCKFNFSL